MGKLDILLPFFQSGMLFINAYILILRQIGGYIPPPQFDLPLAIIFLFGNAAMILTALTHSHRKSYSEGVRDGENLKLKKLIPQAKPK